MLDPSVSFVLALPALLALTDGRIEVDAITVRCLGDDSLDILVLLDDLIIFGLFAFLIIY